MIKIHFLFVAFAVALTSCHSASPRQPAQAERALFPADAFHWTGRTEKVNGREVAVYVTEDDARNCGMSLKLETAGHFRCDLRNTLYPAGTPAMLTSEKAIFEMFHDRARGSSMHVQLSPDFVTIKIEARSLQEASDLLRDQFKPNMNKLRMVKFIVFEKGK